AVIELNQIETGNFFDVDEPLVAREAFFHHEQQLRAAGVDAGAFAVAREQCGSFRNRLRLFEAEASEHLGGLELLLEIAGELIHHLVGLALDHAVAERGELAENVDVGRQSELRPIAVAGERHLELDFHAAADLAVAAARYRFDVGELAAFHNVDVHGELDAERPHLFHHRRGVMFSGLDRARLLAARNAGDETIDVPEKTPHFFFRTVNLDFAFETQANVPPEVIFT